MKRRMGLHQGNTCASSQVQLATLIAQMGNANTCSLELLEGGHGEIQADAAMAEKGEVITAKKHRDKRQEDRVPV